MGFATTLIQWFGHACFMIATVSGIHILIDPVGPKIGYPITPHSIPADVILISHDQSDANYSQLAQDTQPTPKIIGPHETPGYSDDIDNYTLASGEKKSILFRRIFSYCDNVNGKSLGVNTITTIDVDGIRFCHLGALGQQALTPKQVELIGRVDVLMIPVGAYQTMTPKEAAAIVAQLHPKVIIPMSYRTQWVNSDLQEKMHPVDDFIIAMGSKAATMRGDNNVLSLQPDAMPDKPTIVVFSLQ